MRILSSIKFLAVSSNRISSLRRQTVRHYDIRIPNDIISYELKNYRFSRKYNLEQNTSKKDAKIEEFYNYPFDENKQMEFEDKFQKILSHARKTDIKEFQEISEALDENKHNVFGSSEVMKNLFQEEFDAELEASFQTILKFEREFQTRLDLE